MHPSLLHAVGIHLGVQCNTFLLSQWIVVGFFRSVSIDIDHSECVAHLTGIQIKVSIDIEKVIIFLCGHMGTKHGVRIKCDRHIKVQQAAALAYLILEGDLLYRKPSAAGQYHSL